MPSETACWLPMNDGVRLDAQTLVPDGDAPAGGWPGVVLVHGHGENGSKASTLARGRELADRGYVALCYSVRGQGGSEGLSFHLGARELFDLQDVVAWALANLPIHPDRLGVCGSSQGGWHSWMAATHCPQVATAVPQNIFVDFADFAVPQGALSTWFFTRTMRRRVMSAGLQDLARQWAVQGAWDQLAEWQRPLSPCLFADRVHCPVLVIHGWHDVGMPANDLLAMFDRLQVPKRLYLGGGGHDGQDAATAERARKALVDRWLDHWLKGDDNGVMDGPAILYARRPSWAHVGTERLVEDRRIGLYLHEPGTLGPEPPVGPHPNRNVENVGPRRPYGLAQALADDLAGTDELMPCEVAAFDSAPMADDLDLRGIVRFDLHLLPQRPWFQVHARLLDVAPDGTAELITRGHAADRAAEPGRHRRVVVDARAIAYRVAAGHRLRVEVQNHDAAYVVPEYRPWRCRLYCEEGRASCVTLPVLGGG